MIKSLTNRVRGTIDYFVLETGDAFVRAIRKANVARCNGCFGQHDPCRFVLFPWKSQLSTPVDKAG